MLELNPESVAQIAEKAREFQSEEILLPPEPPPVPVDDTAFEYAAEWHGDPGYNELKDAIEDLEPDQQSVLVALMWVGRGDYGIEEWGDALAYAEDVHTDATADYLIATPLLADYLLDGLDKHGYEIE
jgi:hypothetical protein